jgi:nucleotide-binding universal stress UspA family protein
MYERILVAIDGSAMSDAALAEAQSLAELHRSRLEIVHVVDVLSVYGGDSPFVDVVDLEESLTKSGRALLDRTVNALTRAGVAAEGKLLKIEKFDQRIANIVVEEAVRWPADLIIVGTHGRRGLSHLFLGSVAEGIARSATVPVLLVRKR